MKTVAIVGRTNVGKSTLFNRLTGKKRAIVHDMPGVTRDRQEALATLSDLKFNLIDTAGLENTTALSQAMWKQTQTAIQDADVLLMVVDARAELSVLDVQLAKDLRKTSKPVILIANKCEGTEQSINATQAYTLGLGEPVLFSAEHGLGLAELYEALRPYLDEQDDVEEAQPDETPQEKPLNLAIIGRPNVGKSTLVNQLLGYERMLTGPEAGVTRDSVSSPFEWNGRKILLTDTAGLRRNAKITHSLEKLTVADTRNILNFAEVVIMVTSAENPLETQDLTLARQVVEEGRAMVLAINKWDTIPPKEQNNVKNVINQKLRNSLQQVKGLPVVYLSAKTGMGKDLLMKQVFAIYDVWNKRVSTAKLNDWLQRMTQATPPPLASNGRRIPMKYITQVATRPPTFVIFSSNPDTLPESYLRYLSNGLRKDYGLDGTPIRIHMRKRANPYADKK